MGNLLQETPYSEITATMEALATAGVTREGLKKFRNYPASIQRQAALLIERGEIPSPNIISVNHSQPFDPATFIGAGWKIVPGSQDKRAQSITEIDLSKVILENTLKKSESLVDGEVRLKRLQKMKKRIHLDQDCFRAFWENRDRLPEELRQYVLTFDGVVLESPVGSRCVLYLSWHGSQWYWYCRWLGHEFVSCYRSVLLAI